MDRCTSSLRACLQAIGHFHRCFVTIADNADLRWDTVLDEAKRCGLTGRYQSCTSAQLARQSLPAIASGTNGSAFIVAAVRQGTVLVHDPLSGQSETLTLQGLAQR